MQQPRGKDWFSSRIFEVAGWSLLGLYVLVQIASSISVPLKRYDDFIPIVSADLILRGKKPLLDFQSVYPPLYYYVLSWAFRILGRSILVYRLFAAGFEFLLLAQAARFFTVCLPQLRRFLPFALMPLAVAAGILNSPPWPGYCLALLAVLAYARSRYSARPLLWIALGGLYTGASTLIRFNFGVYAIAAVAIDIVINDFIRSTDTARLRRTAIQAAAFVVPAVAVNGIFYIALYGGDAIAAPWRAVQVSLGIVSSMGVMLRPEPAFLLALAFPCAWIWARQMFATNEFGNRALISAASAALLVSFDLLIRHHSWVASVGPATALATLVLLILSIPALPRPVLPLLLFSVCLQHYFLFRADTDHLFVIYPAIAIAIPFLFSLPGTEAAGSSFVPKGYIFGGLLASTFFMASAPFLAPNLVTGGRELFTALREPRKLFEGDRERLAAAADYDEIHDELQAVEFVRARTVASDPIFVGVADHTMPFINSVRVYWLAERAPGTYYLHLDTAAISPPSVQPQIVGELEKNKVDWVVIYNQIVDGKSVYGYLFETKPDTSKILDEYLATHFHAESSFGRYTVLRRNSPS